LRSADDSPGYRLFELEVDTLWPGVKVVGVNDGREESRCLEGTDIGLFDSVVAAVPGLPDLFQADLAALEGLGREVEKVDNRAVGLVKTHQLASLVQDLSQAVHHHSVVRTAELELPESMRGTNLQTEDVQFAHPAPAPLRPDFRNDRTFHLLGTI